jgi:hypothetical protein
VIAKTPSFVAGIGIKILVVPNTSIPERPLILTVYS